MKTRPILFYLVGLPGVGKTTLASRLSHWLGVEHLRGDKIGLELFKFPTYSRHERQMVYGEMNSRAVSSLLANKHVVYDASTNTLSQRQLLCDLAGKNGSQAIGIWVQVDLELAKKRAATYRDMGLAGSVVRVIPPHIFDQYAAAFEQPNNNEDVITISGKDQFVVQYHKLRTNLRGRLHTPKLI